VKTKQQIWDRLVLGGLLIVLLLIVAGCGGLGGTECGNPNNSSSTCTDSTGGDDGAIDDFTCTFCFQGVEASAEPCDTCEPGDGSSGGTTTADCTEASCSLSETGTVLFGICDAAAACDDTVTALTCIEDIYQDRTTLDAFGISSAILSFEGAQTSIDDGSLVVNDSTLSSCETALAALSCTELSTNGYQTGAGDFTTLAASVPAACANVF
jgi:hypothetical protein